MRGVGPWNAGDPERARELRQQQTRAEERLWSRLRDRRLAGAKFRRQVPLGPYTVDFLCAAARLVVEVDGPSHGSEPQEAHDAARTVYLERRGFRVVRFWNHEVLGDIDGVVRAIHDHLGDVGETERGC